MDQMSSEMYEQVMKNHFITRGCWVPTRYKKFPRFTIFTNQLSQTNKVHMADQFISLNPQVLTYLTGIDEESSQIDGAKLVQKVNSSHISSNERRTAKIRPRSYTPDRFESLKHMVQRHLEEKNLKEFTSTVLDTCDDNTRKT